MAPPWHSLFGSISSTLAWNPFSRMALAWHTMWKSLLSVRNGTIFPPWLFHGALVVDVLFNVRLDTISSLILLKGMALPWRPRGAGMALSWRGCGARMALSMALTWWSAWRIRAVVHVYAHSTVCSAMCVCFLWGPAMLTDFPRCGALWVWSLHGVSLYFLSGR